MYGRIQKMKFWDISFLFEIYRCVIELTSIFLFLEKGGSLLTAIRFP